MSEKPVSRQRAYQLRKIAAGLCCLCGRPRNHYAEHCDMCRKKTSELQRKRYAKKVIDKAMASG